MRVIEAIEMTDAVLTGSNVPENDQPEWDAGTAYSQGDKVIVLNTHRIYEALQATTGTDPATDDGSTWLDIGATNRWRAFDGSIEGQVAQATSVQYQFTMQTALSGLALLDVSAASLRVTVTDPVEGVISDKTTTLIDKTEVIDWFSYFYNPLTQTQEVVLSDQPFFAGAIVEVELTGAAVSLGELVIGIDSRLGTSTTGTTLGIEDFSIKQKDDFGRTFILERAFANTVSFEFALPTSGAARVRRILSGLRAKPAVYYTGQGQIPIGATVYGFPRDFSINLQTSVMAFATLEIEGLT